jgi:AcrR family transcriptional regulator
LTPARRTADKSTRRARGSLNEDEILDAASTIIERDGIGGFSMPKLAKYLDAGVMSVYWYFHSKDDLLAALADRAFLDVYSRLPPFTDGPWREETINQASAMHHELRTTSLYLQLCRAYPRCLVLRPSVIPVLAQRLEDELQSFREVDLSASEATRLLAILAAYVRGFALMQVGAEEERNHHAAEQAFEASVSQLSPAKFPTLRAASDVGGVISVSDTSFDTCLRLLVAGMESEFEGPNDPVANAPADAVRARASVSSRSTTRGQRRPTPKRIG